MEEKYFTTALLEMRKSSKKRKFVQSIELMINFKGLDFKKPENQIDVKAALPHGTGKVSGKTLLFAKDDSFISEMKGKVDRIIRENEIAALDRKAVAQLESEYDVLIAEGPVMLTVGKYLGQQLAPKGKMPKPVQASAEAALGQMRELGGVTRITNKKGKPMPVVQVVIGNENMQDAELAANATAVFNAVVQRLPGKRQNIKSVYVKETMGPAIKVEEKKVAEK